MVFGKIVCLAIKSRQRSTKLTDWSTPTHCCCAKCLFAALCKFDTFTFITFIKFSSFTLSQFFAVNFFTFVKTKLKSSWDLTFFQCEGGKTVWAGQDLDKARSWEIMAGQEVTGVFTFPCWCKLCIDLLLKRPLRVFLNSFSCHIRAFVWWGKGWEYKFTVCGLKSSEELIRCLQLCPHPSLTEDWFIDQYRPARAPQPYNTTLGQIVSST